MWKPHRIFEEWGLRHQYCNWALQFLAHALDAQENEQVKIVKYGI